MRRIGGYLRILSSTSSTEYKVRVMDKVQYFTSYDVLCAHWMTVCIIVVGQIRAGQNWLFCLTLGPHVIASTQGRFTNSLTRCIGEVNDNEIRVGTLSKIPYM